MATSDKLDLWYALHDAFIRRIRADAAAARAIVAVDSFHLNEFYGYADGCEFEIRFMDVEEVSVLVSRRRRPAVGPDVNALRRFESASWTEFENVFSDERGPTEQAKYGKRGRYEILQAHATVDTDGIIFVIDEIVDYAGFSAPDSDFLAEVKIGAMTVEVHCPDGEVLTLDEFAARGEAYWREHRNTQ